MMAHFHLPGLPILWESRLETWQPYQCWNRAGQKSSGVAEDSAAHDRLRYP